MYHSDEFLGIEFTDELYHWKYIKKERVNGKWRYYYDIKDALGYDEREKAANAMYRYERAHENVNREYPNKAEMNAAINRVHLLERIAQESMKDFDKTPLGKLEHVNDTINTGRKAISKFLSMVASKIDTSNRLTFTNKYRTIGQEKVYIMGKDDNWKRIYKH